MSEIRESLSGLRPDYLFGNNKIYEGPKLVQIGLIRLTKLCKNGDLDWLFKEAYRINQDDGRVAAVGYFGSDHFALYVNDLTDGEFDRMGDGRR